MSKWQDIASVPQDVVWVRIKTPVEVFVMLMECDLTDGFILLQGCDMNKNKRPYLTDYEWTATGWQPVVYPNV